MTSYQLNTFFNKEIVIDFLLLVLISLLLLLLKQ